MTQVTNLDGVAVIVGAGHGGGAFAFTLRQQGWRGPIILIGAERVAPYQRPPLSKTWLLGKATTADLLLRKPELYAQQGVELRPGVSVVAIDRDGRRVICDNGVEQAYDVLVLATGLRPRPLAIPGGDLEGVLTLRDIGDADALKAAFGARKHLVVIGAGYIGLEAASAARALGLTVTVMEQADRVLARVASPEISSFFRQLHESRGVTFLFGAAVSALRGADGRVSGVELADGRLIPADIVLAGIGGVPNSEIAAAAGLLCDPAIIVDETCRTNDRHIYALGDVTRRPLPIYGATGRLESVQSALEQARQAACAICGKAPPPVETPWFWSDQYDVKLQIAGLAMDSIRRVVRGQAADQRFAVFHLGEGDVVRAVEAVGMPGEFMMAKQWIVQNKAVSVERLLDSSLSIKLAA